MVYEVLLRGLGCYLFSWIMLLWIPSNWNKLLKKKKLTERYLKSLFLQQICKIFFNEIIGCTININMFQLVMKSCKLQQLIAVGWLYLFRTGSEERNRLRHCSLPTLKFFKICQFWTSGTLPWCPPILINHFIITCDTKNCHILNKKKLFRVIWTVKFFLF